MGEILMGLRYKSNESKIKNGKTGRVISEHINSKENFSRRPPHKPPKKSKEKSEE